MSDLDDSRIVTGAPWLTALAWLWSIVFIIGGLGSLIQGGLIFAATQFLIAALALPPLWKRLRDRGVSLPVAARVGGTIGLFIIAAIYAPQKSTPSTESGSASAADEEADGDDNPLTALKKEKLPFEPVLMTRDSYPKFYAKLGSRQFDKANALMSWAALAAAESDQCSQVKDVGISSKATREAIRWYVDCENGERFMISDQQATATKSRLDPASSAAEQKKGQTLAIAEPVSARWKNFDEAMAVSLCDELTKSAMLVPRTFDTGWTDWAIEKNDDTGQVTIERDYEVENAYGMALNSRYRCVINSEAMNIEKLLVREPTGWKKLL